MMDDTSPKYNASNPNAQNNQINAPGEKKRDRNKDAHTHERLYRTRNAINTHIS
jgi:hypothetical protein